MQRLRLRMALPKFLHFNVPCILCLRGTAVHFPAFQLKPTCRTAKAAVQPTTSARNRSCGLRTFLASDREETIVLRGQYSIFTLPRQFGRPVCLFSRLRDLAESIAAWNGIFALGDAVLRQRWIVDVLSLGGAGLYQIPPCVV